jgi:hypothetical protein
MAGTAKQKVRRGERFRMRGSRLSDIAAGAPGGDRKFGVAGSFNSSPYNGSSNFKLESKGMLTYKFQQLSGFSVGQITRESRVTETYYASFGFPRDIQMTSEGRTDRTNPGH